MLLKFISVIALFGYSINFNANQKNPEGVGNHVLCDSISFSKILDKNTPSEVSKIFKKLILKADDSCTLLFLKITVNKYIATRTDKSFQNLNSIACSFDGFISEFFMDYVPKLADNKCYFTRQLYANNLRTQDLNCLQQYIKSYLEVYDTDMFMHNYFKKCSLNSKNRKYRYYIKKLLTHSRTNAM